MCCLKKTCNISVVDFCCTELNRVVKVTGQEVWVDVSRELKVVVVVNARPRRP